MNKKTKVINLLGGPGLGKSSLAMDLASKLKHRGVDAEYVPEYIKKWAWAGRLPGKYDQFYIAGHQTQMESSLYGKVDYIIADSPLLLAGFYEDYNNSPLIVSEAINHFITAASLDGVTRTNLFLTRNKPYNPNGRFNSEEDAINIDHALRAYLKKNQIKIDLEVDCTDDEARAQFVIEQLSLI